MYFEACCCTVISTLTGIVSCVVRLQGSDGQGIDCLPLFHHILVSRPDTLKTFTPVELDPGQRVFTGQCHSLSLFGLHSL